VFDYQAQLNWCSCWR